MSDRAGERGSVTGWVSVSSGQAVNGNVFDVTRNSIGGRFFAVVFGGATEVDLTPRACGSGGDDGAVAVGFAARWESPELRASDSDALPRPVPRRARAGLTKRRKHRREP